MLTKQSLFDCSGTRKYLASRERLAFVFAANREEGPIATFCLTLAITGARISEILALTPERIDLADGAIIIETLKQRRSGNFRAIPVPNALLRRLKDVHRITDPASRGRRLWPWCRTTAWKHIKQVMNKAGIGNPLAKPKALRHGFAVEAGQNGVQLNIVQRWMGHARLETTAIYAGALGREERALARRTWKAFEGALRT